MSAKDEKLVELRVGVFVFVGLLFIAAMAVKFGQIGQGFQKFYPLTVELPNASGLIKNSDVQLAGARVGYVADRPKISPSAGSVTITVNIAEGIKVPKLTHFQVNSSGLLGDRFVEIIPDAQFDPKTFNPNDPKQTWNPGDKVLGQKAGGLDLEALQKKVDQTLDQLSREITDEVGKLKSVTDKIDNEVLSEANRRNITDTFANLKTTTQNFSDASKNLNVVVLNAQDAVDTTKQTLNTVNGAAGDARKVLDTARALITKAQTGDGLVATLLNNRQLSENFQALVVNLREHGVLFYKDRAATGQRAAAPAPASTSTVQQREVRGRLTR